MMSDDTARIDHPRPRRRSPAPRLPAWVWPCFASAALGLASWAHAILWDHQDRLTVLETASYPRTEAAAEATELRDDIASIAQSVAVISAEAAAAKASRGRIEQDLREITRAMRAIENRRDED